MSPEKIPTRTRLALAQKMRRRSGLPGSRDTSPSLDVVLRFTRGWSQEVLAELAGSRSCASCARDISASVHVIHRTYVSSIAPLLRIPAPAALVLPWTSSAASATSVWTISKSWPMPLISASPNCSPPPRLEDMKDRLKDLGIEEPRAHYGPVADPVFVLPILPIYAIIFFVFGQILSQYVSAGAAKECRC